MSGPNRATSSITLSGGTWIEKVRARPPRRVGRRSDRPPGTGRPGQSAHAAGQPRALEEMLAHEPGVAIEIGRGAPAGRAGGHGRLERSPLEAPGEQGLGGPEVLAGRDRQPRAKSAGPRMSRGTAPMDAALAPTAGCARGRGRADAPGATMQPGQPFRRQPGRAQHGTRHAQQHRQPGHGQRHRSEPAAADN